METKSTSVLNLEESMDRPDVPLQDNDALNLYTQRLDSGRDQRTEPRREFDDNTYEADYALNQLAAHSYLRRKKNDDEVRVNTGTAEKKVELILNELLSMNFQPEVRAFDQDDLEVNQLGEDMADIVTRTNEIERDEDLYEDAYLELLTQRAVFIEEDYGPLPTVAIRTGRTGKFRNDKHAQKRLISGLQIFLGDITIPAYRFHEQPWVVKYDRMLYEEAVKLYGDLPKWKYVKPGMPINDNYGMWFKYRLGVLENREVEIVTYMSTADDEYNVIINGVMMYEPGTPLPWRHGGYNMSMIVVKPVSRFFAYGKQPIASAKTLQALADETIRNLVRKMRQAIEPPLGVASGKVYGKDIWSPGAVTQGLPANSFSPLISHQGVTQSEFSMFQLITTKIDEFVGAYGVQQTPGMGTPSATQIVEQQKQSLKMLGLAVLAAQRMKREMTYLRLWNVFEHYLEPTGKTPDTVTKKLKAKFRSFTISSTNLGSGITGKKIIQFTDKQPTEKELAALYQAENKAAAEGRNVRFHLLDTNELRDFPLTWFVDVAPKERNSGALDRAMFTDQLNQVGAISQITGRLPNPDRIIANFEDTWKTKGLFQKQEAIVPGSETGTGGTVQEQAKNMLATLKGSDASSPNLGGAPPGGPQGRETQARKALVPKSPGAMPNATQMANAA